MKKIGLVGGISWTSTLDYYHYINEGINKKLGGLNFAECIIYSVNFNDFQKSNAAHDWESSYQLLANAAISLKHAGADAIVLCANTAHIVADRIEEKVQLPLIHVVTATAKAIHQKQISKVGLLGTAYTMKLNFYKDKLQSYVITCLIPAREEDLDFIQENLKEELSKGIIKPASKARYLDIIQKLINNGAEGIILGCTEIPLLIQQEDVDVPVFNTTKIHADAAVEFALQ